MTAVITGNANAPIIPATLAPSISRGGDIVGSVTGATAPNNFCIVIGSAASAPATFGALANPQYYAEAGFDRFSYTNLATTTLSFAAAGLSFPTSAIGDHFWLCYIGSTDTPVSGTVIDASRSLGLAVA